MSEFGGLWKQQSNPACTKSARAFIMLKLETIQKKMPPVKAVKEILSLSNPDYAFVLRNPHTSQSTLTISLFFLSGKDHHHQSQLYPKRPSSLTEEEALETG